MLVNNMVKAWSERQEDDETVEQVSGPAPRMPAGASPLDEMYLDAVVGAAAEGLDIATLGCTFPTGTNCAGICQTSGCTVA